MKIEKKLSRFIQIPSVRNHHSIQETATLMSECQQTLKTLFPSVHQNVEVIYLSEYALIFKCTGTRSKLRPIVFTAHYDVVPADEGLDEWEHPPFAGFIDDDYVWGRGTLDDKSSLICLLESLEDLLRSGFKPERSIFLAFGGDEESTGVLGAKKIATYFKEQQIFPAVLIDEGSAITKNVFAGIEAPIALIGVAEKGYADFILKVATPPGHSSMPEDDTATSILVKGLHRFFKRPFPLKLTQTTIALFRGLGKHLPFPKGALLRSLPFSAPLVKKILAKSPVTNAMLRTIASVTIITAGDQENVLPASARANINVRILPGETVESCKKHIEKSLGNSGISVMEHSANDLRDPAPETSVNSAEYRLFGKIIQKNNPGTLIAPYLVTGTTDSAHYRDICNCIIRCLPAVYDADAVHSVHGFNEKIAIKQLYNMITNYRDMMIYFSKEVITDDIN